MIAIHRMPITQHAGSDAPPAWIDLIPAGVFSGRDGRGPYKNENPESLIAETRTLGMTAGLPIDFDHAIDNAAPEGRPAPAAGWIKELRNVRGIIQGRVEWRVTGAKAVADKLYRYVSPVFEYSSDGKVQRLMGAALTNNPNLYLTAISSRQRGVVTKMSTSADLRKIATAAGIPPVRLVAMTVLRATNLNASEIAVHAARGAGGRHVIDHMLSQVKASGMDENTPEELIGEAASVLEEILGHVAEPENFKKLGMAGALIHLALEEIAPAYSVLHPDTLDGAPVDDAYNLTDAETLAKTAHSILTVARRNLRGQTTPSLINETRALVQIVIDRGLKRKRP